MPFRIEFHDVQIDGDVRSWTGFLKSFSYRELAKHLAARGLTLNFERGDEISAEWEDDIQIGRIVKGGDRVIGRFKAQFVEELPDQSGGEPETVGSITGSHAYADGGYPVEVPF
jgi:hypothetical protein